MKNVFTLSLLLACTICKGQNLVSNPSFEDKNSCPGGGIILGGVADWYAAEETPDYFHSCGAATLSVPNNTLDSQYAATGNAYCGFATYSTILTNGREKIGVPLLNAMNIGTKYFVSFKVSATKRYFNAATNKTGALFSTVKYTPANPSPTNDFCQIWTDSIITDTVNWVQVGGAFIADSAYTYLTLGNFFTNVHTDTICFWRTNAVQAYYFIDDVCVSTDSLTCNLPVAIQQPRKDDAAIFPNPFSNQLTFTLTNNEAATVTLYDISGRQLLQQSFTNSTTLNTAQFANGIYFYELRNSKGVVKKGKVIRQ